MCTVVPIGTVFFARFNRDFGSDVNVTIATDIGFAASSRTSNTNVDIYENASQFLGNSQTATGIPNANFQLLGSAVLGDYDTAQVGIFGLGAGMTPTQVSALYALLHMPICWAVAGVA